MFLHNPITLLVCARHMDKKHNDNNNQIRIFNIRTKNDARMVNQKCDSETYLKIQYEIDMSCFHVKKAI